MIRDCTEIGLGYNWTPVLCTKTNITLIHTEERRKKRRNRKVRQTDRQTYTQTDRQTETERQRDRWVSG